MKTRQDLKQLFPHMLTRKEALSLNKIYAQLDFLEKQRNIKYNTLTGEVISTTYSKDFLKNFEEKYVDKLVYDKKEELLGKGEPVINQKGLDIYKKRLMNKTSLKAKYFQMLKENIFKKQNFSIEEFEKLNNEMYFLWNILTNEALINKVEKNTNKEAEFLNVAIQDNGLLVESKSNQEVYTMLKHLGLSSNDLKEYQTLLKVEDKEEKKKILSFSDLDIN